MHYCGPDRSPSSKTSLRSCQALQREDMSITDSSEELPQGPGKMRGQGYLCSPLTNLAKYYSSADPDELLKRTKDLSLPLVDGNLSSSSTSPRLFGVSPSAKYGKPVDQELRKTLHDIVVEMHQDQNAGKEWLPQGPDACFSFLTGEDNSEWSFEKVSCPHCAYYTQFNDRGDCR